MPQPTTNTWPFEVKEPPSADGHTGGVVAGVGAWEGDIVGTKLPDAGTLEKGAPGLTPAEPLNDMLLEGLEEPGTVVPENTEDVVVGVLN